MRERWEVVEDGGGGGEEGREIAYSIGGSGKQFKRRSVWVG